MKLSMLAFCGMVFGLLLTARSTALPQDSSAPSKLQVRVNYTGAGKVDEKHKIYVVLWDSPDFVSGGAMPVETQPTSSKNGVVTFADVKKTPAYVSSVFDPSGAWDAESAPPEGSSLGLYSKSPGKPEPVEVNGGKTATIELVFDDTVKMRSGTPGR